MHYTRAFGSGDLKINTKPRIIFLAAFLLCTQWYFTILSTQHALHNMSFKCPVCATVNMYGASAISEAPIINSEFNFVLVANVARYFYYLSSLKAYLSRAPPLA